MKKTSPLIYCVIPCLRDKPELKLSIQSMLDQTVKCHVICVDNGSIDSTKYTLSDFGNKITVLRNQNNLGFSGGVNSGISYALSQEADFIALFNDDAKAEKNWIVQLLESMSNREVGISTGRVLSWDGNKIDTTGDLYSNWLLAFPRGRGQIAEGKYSDAEFVFGATGGATLYRAEVFKKIGLFDQDFFAYYEDIDFSFRAQLAGWKVFYNPKAVAYHRIGATSSKIPGFTTYHSVKNIPLVWIKNLPLRLWWPAIIKFNIAYFLMLIALMRQGKVLYVFKGLALLLYLMPKKLWERSRIQNKRYVSTQYIKSILYPDLPPDRNKLRKLRAKILFWRVYENSN